jgi:hypothetical protein
MVAEGQISDVRQSIALEGLSGGAYALVIGDGANALRMTVVVE